MIPTIHIYFRLIIISFIGFQNFIQAEDGIRDYKVTGVQTCALPISVALRRSSLVSNATVVADQQMEAFRRMRNCEIGLQAQNMPSSTSSYAADTTAYSAAGSYYSSSTAAASQLWVTDYLPSSSQSSYVTTWETTHSPVAPPTDTTSLTGQASPNCVNGSTSTINPHQTAVVGP